MSQIADYRVETPADFIAKQLLRGQRSQHAKGELGS